LKAPPAPPAVDHVLYCLSQPSLSATAARELLAAVAPAAVQAGVTCPVTAIRLEGEGPGLAQALDRAHAGGARRLLVQPLGLPMAANILAWLPGAVAHWQAQAGAGVEVLLGAPPGPGAVLPALVSACAGTARLPAAAIAPSLGKPGWQYPPDHDTHILVCTGPRCAFRGAGTLAQRLKARLAGAGLAKRCLTTSTGCIFPCNQGPVIALYPRGEWYRVPDEAALARIVEVAIGAGRRLPELLLETRPQPRATRISNPERSLT